MTTESLHIRQRVRHPAYGTGTVKTINEQAAEIDFDDGQRRTIAPETSGLAPAESTATLTGLEVPLATLLRDTVEATIRAMGLERPGEIVRQLGTRWHGGKLVLHPADPTLQTKEIELDVFFHKIVMVRNNLRVLEQKINAHEGFSSAEKFDWQQYITRSYGSLTTFNVLFKDKDDQF